MTWLIEVSNLVPLVPYEIEGRRRHALHPWGSRDAFSTSHPYVNPPLLISQSIVFHPSSVRGSSMYVVYRCYNIIVTLSMCEVIVLLGMEVVVVNRS